MRVLLDTHTFLWAVNSDARLSRVAAEIFQGSDAIELSLVSTWELAVKSSVGKLTFDRPLDVFIAEHLRKTQVSLLAIKLEHTLRVAELPLHHRDPFDRLLIAQSLCENMPLLSADPLFDLYGVERIWDELPASLEP